MSVLLQIFDLSKRFKGVVALQNVNLSIKAGTITGIIGPNGSGKTTLLNCITGFVRPSHGKVVYQGKDITGLPPHVIAKYGIVRTFQQRAVFSKATVRDNVRAAFRRKTPRSLPFHNPEEVIDFIGLSAYQLEAADQLAFGLSRLLGLGLALAADPQLLLLDEPAAGLNDAETEKLGRLIAQLRELGLTVVVVDHDMKFIMGLCDWLVVLNAGKRVVEGEPQMVRHHPDVIASYLGENIAEGHRG
jgi:branched-chain amino acid transport system ATP-binding protein